MGLWRKAINKLTGRTEPQVPDAEQERRDSDAAKLAEYTAFDTAVGAIPTQTTLAQRFRDAVYNGHTAVIRDTIEKGVVIPNEVTSIWHSPFGGAPVVFHNKPLELAARREWADMVDLLAPHSNDENLSEALKAAEQKQNIGIAKTIHAEIARRNAPAETLALEERIAVRNTPLTLKVPSNA